MAEIDWEIVSGSLDATLIRRGVTGAFTPPNGGGSFVFGFSSETTATGVSALYVNKTNFAPLKNIAAAATGGSVRMALKKGTSPTSTGWSPFMFLCLRAGAGTSPAPSVNDIGYLLGLENSNPARIVFRKGSPIGGLPATAGSSLRASNEAFLVDTWLHLRLDAVVNPNGDVVLKFFKSDVVVNPVTVPAWNTIPGMTDFIDDALGVLSGSAPLSGGFAGFGQQSAAAQRRSYFDSCQILRQI